MLQKIKNSIKNNNLLGMLFISISYITYYIISLFGKKKNVILFSSFSGRQYSDSPKALYEKIREDSRYSDYRLVWAFNDPGDFPDLKDKININSFAFLTLLLTSKVWISNASIEKLVPFKPKGTYYVNTWHGVPLKMLGPDEKSTSLPIKLWYRYVNIDLFTSTSQYDYDLFQTIFPRIKTNLKVGLPRNEMISKVQEQSKNLRTIFCKEKGIASDARLLLYMPTFREFASEKENELLSSRFLNKVEGNTYLLVRAHYFESIDTENKNIINVSEEELNTLMGISDCLITDYSSALFDYYYTGKPMYLYCYDLEEYIKYRGLYINLFESMGAHNLTLNDLKTLFEHDIEQYNTRNIISEFSMVEDIKVEEILDTIYENL